MQKIGSITIDDTYYPGKDLYSDGEIEDEMLDIAKNVPVYEYNRVIASENPGRFCIIFQMSGRILYNPCRLQKKTVCWR